MCMHFLKIVGVYKLKSHLNATVSVSYFIKNKKVCSSCGIGTWDRLITDLSDVWHVYSRSLHWDTQKLNKPRLI